MNTATQTQSAPAVKKPRSFRATWTGVCAVSGLTFQPGAEIFKNPNGAGYVWHRVEVPAHLLPGAAK